MRCDQARERIGPLLDGELSSDEVHALGTHTDDCPACARYRDELSALRGRMTVARDTAPPGLARRVRAGLALEALSPAERPSKAAPRAALMATLARQWRVGLAHAAVVLIVCAASIAITWWWARGMDAHDALARDVLSAHMRSLLQENPIQVANADTHVVKPWFAGRLDYTPAVKDLSTEGFQLVGGRLDYVGGRRVAALVYRRRLHQVNLFVWPAGGDPVGTWSARLNGYNLLSWTRDGAAFWAISDLNAGELRELLSLL